MNNRQWLAAVAGLAFGQLVWAEGVGESGPAGMASTLPGRGEKWVDRVPELTIDGSSLGAARERGEAMLKAARWTVPLPVSSAGPDGGMLYDAGSAVIWSSSYSMEEMGAEANSAIAVDKATGKARWAEKGISVLATAAGDKGGEMLLDRTTAPTQPGGSGICSVEMMDAASMKSRWTAGLTDYAESALIAGNRVFVGARVPQMNGMQVRSAIGGTGHVSLLPMSNTKLILNLAAFDRQTGAKQWTYILPAGTLSAKPCAFADGVLYVLAVSGPPKPRQSALIALNAADGKAIFTARSVGTYKDRAGQPLFDFLSQVVVTDGVVAAATISGDVVGFDAKTGQEKWRESVAHPKPGAVPPLTQMQMDVEAPVVAGERFLVRPPQLIWLVPQVEKQEIVAVTDGVSADYVGMDLKMGKPRWLLPAKSENRSGRIVVTKPLVSDGVMYIVKDLKLLAVPLDSK